MLLFFKLFFPSINLRLLRTFAQFDSLSHLLKDAEYYFLTILRINHTNPLQGVY